MLDLKKKVFKKNNLDKLVFLSLLLICIIFLIFGVKEVYRIKYLYAYDPPFHMNIAQNVDSKEPMTKTIETYGGEKIEINYPSIMRLLTVTINKVTNLSYLDIYKLFGFFCRILTVLTIYITVKYLVKNKVAAVLASALFLSSQYVFYRSIITFPENLVLPFHILIFYDVIRAIREKKTPYTLPIFFAASMLIHYRSIIVPVILVGILFLYRIYSFIKDKKLAIRFFKSKALVRFILLILIFVILSLPVLGLTIKQYSRYWKGHTDQEATSTWISRTEEDPRYNPLSQETYLSSMGIILCICLLFSLFLLFYKANMEKFTLIVWLGSTFILTRGTQFNIYVPSGRMLIYFIIPAVIASTYLFKLFITKWRKNKKVLALGFPIALIFFFVITLSGTHGWQGISDAEFEACSWINNNIPLDNSLILFENTENSKNNIHYLHAGLENYKIVETRKEILNQVFKDSEIDKDRLKEFYPNKYIYLVTKRDNGNELENSDLDIIYDQNGIVVYKIFAS